MPFRNTKASLVGEGGGKLFLPSSNVIGWIVFNTSGQLWVSGPRATRPRYFLDRKKRLRSSSPSIILCIQTSGRNRHQPRCTVKRKQIQLSLTAMQRSKETEPNTHWTALS